jgi:hypothetical protein
MVIFHSYVSLPKGTSSTLKTSAGRALIPLHPPVDLRPKGRPTEFLTYHSDQPKHSADPQEGHVREEGLGHWIGFLGKILTGNHGFYHEI